MCHQIIMSFTLIAIICQTLTVGFGYLACCSQSRYIIVYSDQTQISVHFSRLYYHSKKHQFVSSFVLKPTFLLSISVVAQKQFFFLTQSGACQWKVLSLGCHCSSLIMNINPGGFRHIQIPRIHECTMIQFNIFNPLR